RISRTSRCGPLEGAGGARMTYRHTPTTRAVLRSLVPVICPPEAEPYGDAIVEHMALMFDAIPPLLGKGIGVATITYDLGALPRYRKRARSLSAEDARTYYASWEHGITPLHKQFAQGMNQLMSLSCYEQPEMLERIGYNVGPWIEKVTKKRLTVYADDVRKQEHQILAPDPLRPRAKKEVA
ncbi:MAG TPA: hypothetical protein VGC41_05830, partial [Kofleriaceae bacterium]